MFSETYSRPSLPNLENPEALSPARLSSPEATAQLSRIVHRLDPWLAFATVVATTAASWSASSWLLSHWQFQ